MRASSKCGRCLYLIAIVDGGVQSSRTEALAKLIREHLKKRKFCTISENHIELCWPAEKVRRAEREEEIHVFAKGMVGRLRYTIPESVSHSATPTSSADFLPKPLFDDALSRIPRRAKLETVYDETGNVIQTHEHAGDFKEW
jgi:hypothetical protein